MVGGKKSFCPYIKSFDINYGSGLREQEVETIPSVIVIEEDVFLFAGICYYPINLFYDLKIKHKSTG
jgi:hypothetical protein